jgi:hypothetical protein
MRLPDVCIGYQMADSVEEEIMDIIDREAENSDSLEVSYHISLSYTGSQSRQMREMNMKSKRRERMCQFQTEESGINAWSKI